MRSGLWFTIVALGCCLPAAPTGALTTTCSHPSREGVMAAMTIPLPSPGSGRALLRVIEGDRAYIRMTGDLAPEEHAAERTEFLLLQSPKVSVAIEVKIWREKPFAIARVDRTCVSDAFERWAPFWWRLHNVLVRHGYNSTALPSGSKEILAWHE